MKSLKYLLVKEFIQIRRNRFMSRAIVLVPIVQMLILVPVVTFDIRHINVFVIDQDLSPMSRALVSRIQGSPFFRIRNTAFSIKTAQEEMLRGRADSYSGEF